jgi:hypothetical protein
MQLPQVKVMKTPISFLGIACGNALFPIICPEEAVEIRHLIRMTDEPIDFLLHEIDKNLATALG